MFCLQDGSPLAETTSPAAPAVPLDEEQTVISNRKDKLWNSMQDPAPRPSAARPPAARPPVHQQVRSSSTPVVALTALLTTLLVAAGIGAWLYFRDPPAETAKADNTANTARRTDQVTNSVPAATAEPSPSRAERVDANAANADPESNSPAVVDKESMSRDVSQQIERWKSVTEDGEIDELMDTYAERVDYYRRSGANAEFIRNDKERAFSNFDSIKFDIANMNVSVDSSGERATAEFDKSWVFEGAERSSGKVRQQLKLRKIDGQWRIVGERDLKLYYKN